MKKLFDALMMCCALLLLACGGKKTQGESGDTDSDSITSERQQYRFEHQFIKADDKNYDSIVVKGYKDGKVAFECRHELVDYVSVENAADMEWINDTTDINFDGIPDLQVYRSVFVIHLDELMLKTVLLAQTGYAIRACVTTLSLSFLTSASQ